LCNNHTLRPARPPAGGGVWVGDRGVEDFCRRENLPILLRIPHSALVLVVTNRLTESLKYFFQLYYLVKTMNGGNNKAINPGDLQVGNTQTGRPVQTTLLPVLEVEFDKPRHGYWDGGAKKGGTFIPEAEWYGAPLTFKKKSVIRWGCYGLNFWFNAGSGRSWKEAASIATQTEGIIRGACHHNYPMEGETMNEQQPLYSRWDMDQQKTIKHRPIGVLLWRW